MQSTLISSDAVDVSLSHIFPSDYKMNPQIQQRHFNESLNYSNLEDSKQAKQESITLKLLFTTRHLLLLHYQYFFFQHMREHGSEKCGV